MPPGLDNSPNPLLDFSKEGMTRRSEMLEQAEGSLQPLSPFMPGEVPPAELIPGEQPDNPLTPEQQELMAFAEKIASSVVSIRVWDQFGGLLASGVGSFVSSDGLILTDSSLLHPDIADRIDYITTTAANGTNHRVTGYYIADLRTGVALLQGDGPAPRALELKPEVDFSKTQSCRVVALSEKRGLLIADAKVSVDETLAGQGWLTLKGEDSPGGVGSPVLSDQGDIIGIVAMKTPIDSWMNFALPAEWAAFEIQKKRPFLKTLKELPGSPRSAEITTDPDFVTAFQQVKTRAVGPATRRLLELTKRYPRSAECWALLGLSTSYMGATPDALTCQRRAVALDPQSGLHWHQMAVAQLRARTAEGENPATASAEEYEALVNATGANSNDRVSWLLLATHQIRAGRLEEAQESLRRLTFLAPTYAQGFYLLSFVQSQLANTTGAAEAISRCLKINSDQPNGWFLLGLIEDKLKQPKKAAEAYRKVVRLQPSHPQAWLNLARSLKNANLPTEAAQAFREHQTRVLSVKESLQTAKPAR